MGLNSRVRACVSALLEYRFRFSSSFFCNLRASHKRSTRRRDEAVCSVTDGTLMPPPYRRTLPGTTYPRYHTGNTGNIPPPLGGVSAPIFSKTSGRRRRRKTGNI